MCLIRASSIRSPILGCQVFLEVKVSRQHKVGRMGWRKNWEVSGQGRGKQEVQWERLGLDLGGTRF